MKKILSLLLILCVLLGLAGCQAPQDLQMQTSPSTQATTQPLFWPPLPEETEATENTASTADTQPDTKPAETTGKPADSDTGSSTDATYIPRQEDETDPPTQPETQPQQEDPRPAQTEATQPPPETTQVTEPEEDRPAPPVVGGLKVHFIDVGQADAILIQCEGKNMLIDGGNRADSNVMYTYLKKYGVTHLDYVIGTHAHEDHIGGIPGALQYATASVVYCPVKTYSSKAFTNFANAASNRGAPLTIPKVGTSFTLGTATVEILAVNTETDTNNTSIVTRITHGSNSFLFMGDAEREVEQYLINKSAAQKVTVLKVGHHGSSTSSSYQFLWNVMPEYAVISVGTGNSYGHPHDEVLSRFRDAGVTLFRTDLQGDIICTSDGATVSFTVSRNANADTYN